MPVKSRAKSTTRTAVKSATKPSPPRRPAKTAARKAVKSGYINARVEPELKKSAEAVLDKIGMSTTDAVTIFLKQVVAHKGLPFPVKVPNRETIRALRDAEAGRTERFEGSAQELFAHILGKTRR